MSTSGEIITAWTRPPAKLNLFLELLARRDDGFHEIDTVMVPVDWRDELYLRRTEQPQVRVSVEFRPTIEELSSQLGVAPDSERGRQLWSIPTGPENLVHRALQRFLETFGVGGGFDCRLIKSIPSGAGMGGASSDAAGALRCAATLCGVPLNHASNVSIAASIGSDVPFFLGRDGTDRSRQTQQGRPEADKIPRQTADTVGAMRATGRGEKLQELKVPRPLDVVIAFPAVTLSTAKVYSLAQLPNEASREPQTAYRLIDALAQGDTDQVGKEMMNRLSEPAKKLAPEINRLLESLRRTGLEHCQMTGSGSACFAIASTSSEASQGAQQARAQLQPGALVTCTQTTGVPAPVEIT